MHRHQTPTINNETPPPPTQLSKKNHTQSHKTHPLPNKKPTTTTKKKEWNDMNLRWNTSEYGGVKDLRIPPHRIWKPDVLMYNRLLFFLILKI